MQKKYFYILVFSLLIFKSYALDLMHIKIKKFGIIYDIYEIKKEKQLLIAAEKGVYIYTGKKITKIKGLGKNTFHKIAFVQDVLYLLSFNNLIYKLDKDKLSFVANLETSQNTNDFYCIKDAIYICYPNQLQVYRNHKVGTKYKDNKFYNFGILKKDSLNFLFSQTNNTLQFINLEDDKKFSIPFGKKIKKVFLSKNNNYFIADNSLFTITHQGFTKVISLPNELLNTKIYTIKKIVDAIYIGHNNGFTIYSIKDKTFEHSFKQHAVHCIIQDSFQNIWLGTKFEGLIQIPSKNIFQFEINNILDNKDKIVSTYKFRQNLYLGTNFGKLIIYNLANNKAKIISLQNNAEVQSIFQKGNNLYVYCDKLYQISLKTYKTLKKYSVHSTKDIFVDKDIYCATSGDFQNITQNKKVNKGLWHTCIYLDSIKQNFYLGTKTGISIVSKKKLQSISNINKNIKIIRIKNRDNQLHFFDNKGNIYDDKLNTIKSYPINKVTGVTDLDADDFLLFNHTNVLLVNNNKTERINFISKLIENKPIINIIKSNDNLIVITSEKIYTIKNYNQFFNSNPDEKIQLIITPNREITTNNTYLSYKENNLLFRIKSNLDLSFFSDYNIFYQLNNKDKNEIESNKNGEYILKLDFLPIGNSAINFFLKNKNGKTLNNKEYNIYVKAPFWKSIWFLLILISVFITAIFYYQKKRIQKINAINLEKIKKEKLKTKLLKSELTAIRSQMNPHFVFNTLSTIQLKIAKQETNTAFKLVQKFSSLMRGVLNLSQVEIITLKQELDILKNYIDLEQERFDKEIFINYHIDDKIDLSDFNIPSLITQPLVENSLQHGLRHKKGIKKLDISIIQLNENSFQFIIKDNGIGIDAANEINQQNNWKKSFAMEAIKRRIKFVNSLKNLKVVLNITSNSNGTIAQITVHNYD
ncbi:MAG TPA: hypothetical protein ENK67_00605 [Flavobacteriia bacterium]|nr:hypothetical protein [Flavobacteriia bacterium]